MRWAVFSATGPAAAWVVPAACRRCRRTVAPLLCCLLGGGKIADAIMTYKTGLNCVPSRSSYAATAAAPTPLQLAGAGGAGEDGGREEGAVLCSGSGWTSWLALAAGTH